MPVINGVYLKDFPALPSSVVDANIIPIAESGNQVAYRTTVGGIVTDARVTGKVLTGLSVTGGAVISTDTILQAFGKVQNQLNNRVSSVGLSMPSAFTVTNSPVTGSGTLTVTGAGLASQYIRGDGQLADFPTGGGGGSSVSYYLNGSVNQGTFSGNTYYEMNKTAILGAGTDFTISADGYIAQFITDANDPNTLLIPAGNWNLEFYFSASSSGGSPSYYVELSKWNGSSFTAIANNSATPELISFGTSTQAYFSTLAVPETVLLATDRLAIRVYVNHSGRTITLHTENNTLCQIITTFTTGLQSLNGLTKQTQFFAVGTSGTDFAISSATDTHTFNLPTASAINRGALSSADWTTFNSKQNAITLTTTGTSGAATLIGSTLNIPNYADGGVLSLSAIGSSPNANAATITGTVLNLEPASASFGGVVTTGTQTFAGDKTFSSDIVVNDVRVGIGTGNLNTNTIVGKNVLAVNSTGIQNTAIGEASMFSATSASSNTAIGRTSLYLLTTGGSNTSIGLESLASLTTGSDNVALGNNAGKLTTGNAANATSGTSVYLGSDSRPSANANANEIVIGYQSRGGGSNSVTLGNTNITKTILQGQIQNPVGTSTSYLTTTASSGLEIRSDGSTAADRNIIFKLGTTVQGQIYNSGNWFVGSSPTDAGYKLDVNGTGRFSGALTINSSAAKLFEIGSTSASGGYTRFTYNTTTSIGYIGSSSQLSGTGIVSDLELRADNNLFLTTTKGYIKLGSNGTTTVEIPVESPASGNPALIVKTSNGGNDIFRWFDGATQLGVFKNNGNVVSGATSGVGTAFKPAFQSKTISGLSAGFGIISANDEMAGGLQLASSGSNSLLINVDPDNLRASSEFYIYIDGGEKMRITSGGNVEIKSAGKLIVYRSDNTRFGEFYTDNLAVHLTSSNDPIRITSADRTEFYNGGSERMRITSGGELLIATTTDSGDYKLQVNGNVLATGYFESSSVQGKNIIQTNPLTQIYPDVIQYTRKTDENKDVRYGYSAEQIHSLMPELTDENVISVKYIDVHTLLIAQLQKEIKELKSKING